LSLSSSTVRRASSLKLYSLLLYYLSLDMQPVLLCMIALLLSVDGFLLSDQKNSLVSLYDATGGPFWTNPSNKWNISADPCEPPVWFGVQCDPSKVNVTSLKLDNNNLTGSLPDMHLPALLHL
jgi:hypothetical protein